MEATGVAVALELEDRTPGQLYTWGRNGDGQLGQDKVCLPPGGRTDRQCALPFPEPGLDRVIDVSCGAGEQGCTAVVTMEGHLLTFGNNTKGRLGHSPGVRAVRRPTRVLGPFARLPVKRVACGKTHMLALDAGGGVWSWGKNGGGCLGLAGAVADNALVALPAAVALPPGTGRIIAVGACNEISGVLTSAGALLLWGAPECTPCSTFGGVSNRLGFGASRGGKRTGASTDVPTRVEGFDSPVVGFSLGSVYSWMCILFTADISRDSC